MTGAEFWPRRPLRLGGLALALVLGLLIFAAPATPPGSRGSSWYRGPAGYSAWYQSLQQQGIPIQRWQRPRADLLKQLEDAQATTVTGVKNPPAALETLLAVLPDWTAEENLPSLLPGMTQWLEAGHRLVVLGVKVPVTAAPFSQTLTSPVGPVKIDTRRRYGGAATQPWGLQDPYGAVVWQYAYGAGELVLAATPHLAANAYQDQAGNFALLTQLVAKPGGRVWVDEYLHGYRDEAVITAAVGGATWLHYLARTPVLILASQALVVTLLALLAWNRRLGRRTSLPSVVVDNSQAYIQALAGVLRRAGSHDFVTQTLSQATRQQLQKSLGLGEAHLPLEVLQTAWEQHSGGAAKDLAAILTPPAIQGDAQLRAWLQQLQSLQLGSQETPHGHE